MRSLLTRFVLHAVALIGLAGAGHAQEITNPADRMRPAGRDTAAATRRIVWEMDPVEIRGRRLSRLREEHPVGPYGQPRWTAHRRFGSTRVYVVPRGYFEFEYWMTNRFVDGELAKTAIQYEFTMGLPGRTQVDLYSVYEKSGKEGTLAMSEQKAELRWALADWNVLPANPTLYLEWIGVSDGPDHVEGKLLLGGQLSTGWHWGTNLVLEHETGGAMENSYELTSGLSRTLSDGTFSIGGEAKLAWVDVRGYRGDYERVHSVGPSMQWNLMHRVHLDVLTLFGATSAAPDADVIAVLGYEF